jgi:LIVCS family branched-chain amino acid:cation transporter
MFAIFFFALVFLVTYQPSRLLQIIGKVLSPLKVISIISIVLLGVFSGLTPSVIQVSASEIFFTGFNRGYETLDLLGAIFFGSIIVTLLTQYVPEGRRLSTKEAVTVAGYSSVFAAILLAGVYAGMTYLGAFHGHGLDHLNEGQIFSAISFRVLGNYGAALIGCTVFLACFTTTVSVTAVVADYIKRTLSRNTLPYAASVAVVLILATLTASFGLGPIITYSKPFILFFYPIFIVITFCNILYTLFDFPYIKLPVAVTAVALLVKSLIAAM